MILDPYMNLWDSAFVLQGVWIRMALAVPGPNPSEPHVWGFKAEVLYGLQEQR